MAVGPALARHYRVYALDLAGFGRTPARVPSWDRGQSDAAIPATGARPADVISNRDLVDLFLEHVAGSPAVLMGNSMGGLITMMETARHPNRVRAAVLVDAAMPGRFRALLSPIALAFIVTLAFPRRAERFVAYRFQRRGLEAVVHETLALCTVDPQRIPSEVVQAHVEQAGERAGMPWAHGAYVEAARSLMAVLGQRWRFDSMVRAIRCPALIVHGTEDRLVPFAAAERVARMRADWGFAAMPDIGHVPQMEAPTEFVEIVERWLESVLQVPQEQAV